VDAPGACDRFEPTDLPGAEPTPLFTLSDASYLRQTVALLRRCRRLGHTGRMGVLLLDPVPERERARLADLAVEVVVSASDAWRNGLEKSGLKLFLPKFFHSPRYLLLDSDTLPLDRRLFRLRTDPERLALVEESDLFWPASDRGVTAATHPEVVGSPVLQTGLYQIERRTWERLFPRIEARIRSDSSAFGDMAAVNSFCRSHPGDFQSLPETAHLVLRPRGDGPSSAAHLPKLAVADGRLRFKDRDVLAIHYTHSRGRVRSVRDYRRLFPGWRPGRDRTPDETVIRL